MRGTGDALESELAHAACRVRAAGGTFAKHARVCPTCNAALSTFAIAGVEIDSCPAHGTWFDRDEIGKIVAECRRAKKKSGAPEGASIGHAVGFFAGVPGLLADGIYAMFKNAFSGESTDWD